MYNWHKWTGIIERVGLQMPPHVDREAADAGQDIV